MYPLKALRDKLIHAVRLQLKKLPEVKLSKVPLGLNSFFPALHRQVAQTAGSLSTRINSPLSCTSYLYDNTTKLSHTLTSDT